MRLLLSLLLSASWLGLSLAAPGDDQRNSHTVTETGWDFQQAPSEDDVEILYTLEAYECDERYKHVIFPTYEQGEVVRICIKLIDDQAIADGFSLVDLASVYYQKEHWTQYAIEDGQPDFFGFSDFDCYPERQLCWLETKLWEEFFDTEGFVHLTGLGILKDAASTTTLGSIQVGFPITANKEPPVWLQDSKERITSVEALVLFVISFSCVALAWMVRPWRKTSTSNTVVAIASDNDTDYQDVPIQESIAIPNGNTEHSLHTRGTTKTLLMNGDTIETEGDLLERGTKTLLRRGGCVVLETGQPSTLLNEEPVCLDRGTTNQEEEQQQQQHRRRKHRSKDRSRGASKSDSRRREALLKRGKKSISTRQFGRKDNGESPPSVPKRKRMKKKRSQRARSEHKDKINNNSNSTKMTQAMTETNSYHSSPQPPVRKKERRGRRKSRRNCIVLISDGESDVSSLYFDHHIPSCRSEPLPRRKRKSRRNCIVHVKDTDSVVSSLY